MSEPIDEPGDFLPGYLAGDLSLEDERVMLASAATSQEFFNRLMEAEALRDALSSPEQRDRLRAALQAWEGRPQPNCAGDGGHDDEIDCVSFAGILVPSEIRCDLPQAVHPPSVDLGALEPGTLTHAQQGGERSLSAGARTFAIAATIIVCLLLPYTASRWSRLVSSLQRPVATFAGTKPMAVPTAAMKLPLDRKQQAGRSASVPCAC